VKPADGRLRHAIGAGEISLRSALSKALDRLALLVRCQDSGAPEFHAVGLRSLAAIAGASTDQVTLELGEPAEPATRRSRVMLMRTVLGARPVALSTLVDKLKLYPTHES